MLKAGCIWPLRNERDRRGRMGSRAKIHTGELYDPMDGEVAEVQKECMRLLYQFNATGPDEQEHRNELM